MCVCLVKLMFSPTSKCDSSLVLDSGHLNSLTLFYAVKLVSARSLKLL